MKKILIGLLFLGILFVAGCSSNTENTNAQQVAMAPVCDSSLIKEYYIDHSITQFSGICFYQYNSSGMEIHREHYYRRTVTNDMNNLYDGICINNVKHYDVPDYTVEVPYFEVDQDYTQVICHYRGLLILNITTNVLYTNETTTYLVKYPIERNCDGARCYGSEFRWDINQQVDEILRNEY